MFEDKSIDEKTYFKFLINIAYDYLLENRLSRASVLIQNVSNKYIENEMIQQCEEDEEFFQVCYELAQKHLKHGIITFDKEYTLTQSPTEA